MNFKKISTEKDYCYIIGEAGLNHNGSLALAKELIEIAYNAGVDAVKFQKRQVDKLAVKNELDKKDDRFPEFGKTYREIRNHLEFDKDQYLELKKYSNNFGLDFIVTAFDIDSVDFLLDIDLDVFKLASHSLTNLDLLEYLAKIKKPSILSTGMSDIEDIDLAQNIFKRNNCELIILHCVSSYPTPPDQVNLKMLDLLQSRYSNIVGYSGHELGYLPTLSAVSRGAKVIERHFTKDKEMIGFDHKISLEPNELKNMVSQIREIQKYLTFTEKKITDFEKITSNKYHVSAVLNKNLNKGEILKKNYIEFKNPGTGIPPKTIHKIIGKKAKDNIESDTILDFSMFL